MSAHAGTELLSAYLDGQVPEAARARLEAHLASCPECAGKRAALEAAVGAVAALPPVSPTAGEKEAIRRGVLERVTRTGQPAGRGAGAWRPTLRWRLSAAGGAAALVIAGVFAYVAVRSSSPTPRATTGSAPAASSPAAPAFSSGAEVLAYAASLPAVVQGVRTHTAADAAPATDSFLSRLAASPEAGAASPGGAGFSASTPRAAAPAPEKAMASPAPRPGSLAGCVQSVISAQPGPLVPLAEASVTFQGRPAWLFVFASGPAGATGGPLSQVDVRVLAQASCATLNQSSFPP